MNCLWGGNEKSINEIFAVAHCTDKQVPLDNKNTSLKNNLSRSEAICTEKDPNLVGCTLF